MNRKTIRVLHVVYAMNLGGIESWLMHLYREVVKDGIQFDFLVNIQAEGAYDVEINKLGGQIIFGQHYKHPIKQYFHLKNKFKRRANYSAIHIHNIESASIVHLALKNKSDTNIIIQSHNDFYKEMRFISAIGKIWLVFNKFYVNFFVKNKIAVSSIAGESMFWKNKYNIIPIGESFQSYEKKIKTLKKEDFNLTETDIVISHVGRFFEPKNHLFLLQIILGLKKRQTHSFKCLLIGEGPTQKDCIKFVAKHNLTEDVLFLNSRTDVPEILTQVTDLFIFPSLYEGLGLAVVEAQAAGLPIICSNTIPNEAIIIPELVNKIDLLKNEEFWVSEIISHFEKFKNYSKPAALKKVIKSDLNIQVGIKQYIALWTKK